MPLRRPGYLTGKSRNFEVLVIKSECADEDKTRLLSEFLDVPELEIVRGNVSADKPYAKKLEAFKERIRFPSDHVDELVESKYFQHFYRDEKDAIVGNLRVAHGEEQVL